MAKKKAGKKKKILSSNERQNKYMDNLKKKGYKIARVRCRVEVELKVKAYAEKLSKKLDKEEGIEE